MKRFVLFLGFVSAAGAGEFAVLESGFRLRIERHESNGDTVRLYTTKDGFVEMPSNAVIAFEAEDYVPPPPAPPPVMAAAPTPKPAPTPKELVEVAARHNGIPPEFLHLVAKQESGYRQDAVSPKGAIGIMQLMPATATALDADPFDAAQNVEAGARLLRDLLVQYQNHPDQLRRALAAYNAGPGAVAKYNGVPPYRETQAYVERIVEGYRREVTARK
ncbi:MAG: lytic transglycosylase domain-containing protein [Candidatus Solibacter usitatus]|nr:lytic transglycosylase domain-containing protein [Candidatus Solibacter usitatus]